VKWCLRRLVLPNNHRNHAGVMLACRYLGWLEEARVGALASPRAGLQRALVAGLELPVVAFGGWITANPCRHGRCPWRWRSVVESLRRLL